MLLSLFCLITYGYVQAIPAPGHGALAGYCMDNSDCATDVQCCVTPAHVKGKRQLSSLTQNMGTCHRTGTNGTDCFVTTHLLATGTYYKCPCAKGFTCVGTGMYEVPLGEHGRCTPSSTGMGVSTLNMPCNSGADCGSNECCVSNVSPIGRKRAAHGHCKQMGAIGTNCLVRNGSGKPGHMVYDSCPCTSSLICHGHGTYVVPLGETGTCQKH